MKNKVFVGIDVSKLTLDIFILDRKYHFTVENGTAGFPVLIERCCKVASCSRKDLFLCFENTGKYSRLLAVFLNDMRVPFCQVSAMDIKKSRGISRGKSDKADAKTIALYAYRKKDESEPTVLHLPEVGVLRQLLALREKLIRHRTAYKNTIPDLKDCFFEGETDFIRQTHIKLIETLDKEIKKVEAKIKAIINSMPDWKTNFRLMKTVKGIGPVISMYLIIYTENFMRFPSYRKFACYAGTAPFEYSSGTSIKGKTRVHVCANKQLKSLLNMAAMNVANKKGEFGQYYRRRQEMGKNNMSTLNIIRNKLIARVFAVVKRQSPYVDMIKYAA